MLLAPQNSISGRKISSCIGFVENNFIVCYNKAKWRNIYERVRTLTKREGGGVSDAVKNASSQRMKNVSQPPRRTRVFHEEENIMLRRTICIMLGIALIMSLAIPAFAANEPFYFRLSGEQTKRMHAYLNAYNIKEYVENHGTIKTTYNEAPGYGYLLRLGTRIGTSSELLYATKSYWYHGAMLLYPAYEPGRAIKHEKYYIEGRVDNDYPQTYLVEGVFNADEVAFN